MRIKKKTAQGSLWNLVRTFSTNGIDFIVYALLARVLSIEDFALLIFCLLIVEFASIFPRVGVAQNLIQRKEWELGFASSTFTFMSAFSFVISILLASIGSLIAYKTHSLDAVYLILALSLIPFIVGMHNVLSAKMERDFKQANITAISAGATISSGLLAIVLIYAGWGIWALVIQKVLNHVLMLIFFALYARFKPSLIIRKHHLQELKSFCLPLLGAEILTYVNRKANNFYAALVLGPSAFALISIAKKGEEVLTQSTLSPINKMIVPSLSRISDNKKAEAYYGILEMSSYIVIPCFLGLGAVAMPFITLSFGETYTISASLLTISSFAIIANVLMWYLPNLLVSIAETKAAFQLNIVSTTVTLLVGAISVNWGLHALVVGICCAFYIMLPIKVAIVRRHIDISLLRSLKMIIPPCVASTVMIGVIYFARQYLLNDGVVDSIHSDYGPLLSLVILVSLGILTYVGILFLLFKKHSASQLSKLRGLFGQA